MTSFLVSLLLVLLLGSIVYCILAMTGAAAWLAKRTAELPEFPPVSVLRPMAGVEDNTEPNLRSIFEQRYPAFEVLMAVHEESDPAVPVAKRVMADYPNIPAQLIIAGPSPFPNAKVWSLRALLPHAQNEIFVMSDSDILIAPEGLRTVISELSRPRVALVSCPYRAVGRGFWSKLEAIGLNTEFIAGILTARLLSGMDFAVGCTIATRKTELEAIGGLEYLQRYLAEDFMMGRLMRQRGRKIMLSRCIIEHHIGNGGFRRSWRHRLRWARSTRRSRRVGYWGELFTKNTAIALILLAVAPGAWGFALIALVFRAGMDAMMGLWVLNDPLMARYWWLLPIEEILSFIAWVLGFFGKTLTWRGRKLVVARDGSFEM